VRPRGALRLDHPAVKELVRGRPAQDQRGRLRRVEAGRNADVLKRVLAAQSKSTEYLYDPKNRAEVVNILVKVSGQNLEDVDKSYDFFNKNNFFDRTGKISRVKINALIDALVSLGDVKTPGNVERFLLAGVAQLSD
jgi:NitT/TauT family transport system substrate-binding protein